MGKLLWDVIEKSKIDTNFDSAKQYDNLVEILSNLSIETVKKIDDEWHNICSKIINNKFYNNLHMSNGGIVYGGDDIFFMDFPNWIVA